VGAEGTLVPLEFWDSEKRTEKDGQSIAISPLGFKIPNP